MRIEESNTAQLVAAWTKAAECLGLDIVAPFSAVLSSGQTVHAVLLVRDFGAAKGMLIVDDYNEVREKLLALNEAGYGFSVLEAADEQFVLADYVEVLRDWGWRGETERQAPRWLHVSAASTE